MTDAATPTALSEESKANYPAHSQPQCWRVARASVQGTSHAKTGQPCQDSSSVGEDAPQGIFVAAVADGAGSAELSAEGSRLAACAATRMAARLLRLHVQPFYEGVLKEILNDAVHFARKELQAEAHRHEKELRSFATTLIVAICAPEITGAAQIGDGAMITAGKRLQQDDEDGGYALFSAPQRGEYANTTNFITSDNWQASLDVKAQYGSVSHVAMFTDGTQSIALNAVSGNTPHSPFFDPLFRWLERQVDYEDAGDSLAAFLSSPRVTARADDDLTLLLAVRK